MQCGVVVLLAAYISCASSETKIWRPQGQSVDEWYSHPVKCPKTALTFENDALEFFEGNSHEREIIFAVTGYYIFQNNAHMVIGDSPQITSQECANAFGDSITVHSVKPQPWASPNNWQSDTNDNPAKPDIEKIPCESDEIVFNTSVTRVDLDGIYQLKMKRVSIMDKWLQPREFGSFCKTVAGQKMFDNCEYVDVSPMMGDPAIKACQSNVKFYEALVCENVQCLLPKCMDAIRPIGFCCDICGASAQIEIHSSSQLNISQLDQAIIKKLATTWSNGEVQIHSSFFNSNTKFLLQVNIVDSGEYRGESPKAMEKVYSDLLVKGFANVKVYRSGTPYDPTRSVNTFTLIFMPLLLVLSIFFVAYKASYDDDFLTNWRVLLNRFTGRSQFIFAQFENVLEDHEGRITISHTQPERRSSPPVQPVVEAGVECSADNAMEMVAGGPDDKSALGRDKLDEIVETISNTESASLISVDM